MWSWVTGLRIIECRCGRSIKIKNSIRFAKYEWARYMRAEVKKGDMMGAYDIYGPESIEIKAGRCEMVSYNIGEEVPLDDGIYVGYEGMIMIYKGRLVGTTTDIFDKWGAPIEIDLNNKNPILKVLKDMGYGD